MNEANPGRLHRVDPAVLDDDPFWSVVRRRHPDLDVVVLPEEGEEPPGPGVPVDVVRLAADGALETWRLVRPALVAAGADDAPSVRWGRRAEGDALIIEKAATGIGQDGGTDLLRAITVILGRAGWRLRPTTRDDLPVLETTNGTTDLRAVAGPGATVVTIATGVLPVADTDRAAVTADVHEVLTSWA